MSKGRGFKRAIEGLELLNTKEFGGAICSYLDHYFAAFGESTLHFAVVPNLVADETVMHRKPLIMAMRMEQWESLAEIDEDLLCVHMCGHFDDKNKSTSVRIYAMTKKLSTRGRRVEISAKLEWVPHISYVKKNPDWWRSTVCERASVAFVALHRFRRSTVVSQVPPRRDAAYCKVH